jgi:RNA recognition motif-containing protein
MKESARQSSKRSGSSQAQKGSRSMTQSIAVKLFVGNLSPSTTENTLRQLFSQSGKVASVNLVKDRNSGQSKGYAFVTMASATGAQTAVAKLHNAQVGDRPLTVKLAEPAQRAERAKPASAGYESRLGAFSVTDRSPKSSAPPSKTSRGGYQSKLGAFGNSSPAPTPPRRRGGSQRH